jgi:hypothetical protein
MHNLQTTAQDETWSTEHLTRMIVGYLAEHPQAMDTVEGIAEWWVRRQEVRCLIQNVTQVVQSLIQAGVLEQIGSGPESRFRLARPAVQSPESVWPATNKTQTSTVRDSNLPPS